MSIELYGQHENTPKTNAPGWNMAQGMGTTPNPSIGASVNYVQGIQNEGRTQSFAQGANEAKTANGSGLGGMAKKVFGGGSGDAAAGGAAASAGEGLAADAAIVAV